MNGTNEQAGAIDPHGQDRHVSGYVQPYRLKGSVAEIADLFQATPSPGANYGEEVYPGYPGLVVAEGWARTMTWGFPLALTGKLGQKLKPKAVTNAREDKLHTGFWRSSFETRRCLIPASAWAEAVGEKGRMTRTWYALSGGEPFAIGGLWRPTVEWSHAYSMVMVNSSAGMVDVHDRMPVILRPEDWETWANGAPADAFDLCQTWPGDLDVDHTAQRWAG